jgi:hypothetical protein
MEKYHTRRPSEIAEIDDYAANDSIISYTTSTTPR